MASQFEMNKAPFIVTNCLQPTNEVIAMNSLVEKREICNSVTGDIVKYKL